MRWSHRHLLDGEGDEQPALVAGVEAHVRELLANVLPAAGGPRGRREVGGAMGVRSGCCVMAVCCCVMVMWVRCCVAIAAGVPARLQPLGALDAVERHPVRLDGALAVQLLEREVAVGHEVIVAALHPSGPGTWAGVFGRRERR